VSFTSETPNILNGSAILDEFTNVALPHSLPVVHHALHLMQRGFLDLDPFAFQLILLIVTHFGSRISLAVVASACRNERGNIS
jgi:hypothetical protein